MRPSSPIVFFVLAFSTVSLATPFPACSTNGNSCTNPKDSQELIDRGRGGGGADAVLDIGSAIIEGIMEGVAADKEKRGAFTRDVVSSLYANDSSYNYVIVDSAHTTNFNGTEGVDWSHIHKELDVQIGGTVGYEIYTFKAGSFLLRGDGGWLNWAFIGNVVSDTGGRPPRTVTFASSV